jgi:hypothetical protein
MSELRFWRPALLLFMLLAHSAQAEIMMPTLPPGSIGLGLSTLHVLQPDSDTEQRYRWDLHEFMRLPWGFRVHNRLGIARDTRPRADSVQVHHHFYELASTLQWTGTHLFRYGVGLGPLLLVEQTITRIRIDRNIERTNNRLQLGTSLEAQLDYAFNTTWELALIGAIQLRPATNKQDFSFGVSLQYNKGGPRKDDTTKPRIAATAPPAPL